MADGFLNELLLVIAIAFGTINVVGGFLVTDRMLEMFKTRAKPEVTTRDASCQDPDFIRVLYIVAFVAASSSACALLTTRARRAGATWIAAVGMAIAVIATLLIESVGDYGLIALGIAIGTAVGRPRGAPGEDDRDAADGGAVQRRRRRRGGADLVGRVPRTRRARATTRSSRR